MSDNEKFPLDVLPVAGGAERRRSCQSLIARCFILLSPESQSQLISAPHPTVPDPNLPPPSSCPPRCHSNGDQPCGTHTHTHIQTHTHRPVVFKEKSTSATYENELKSGCRQNSQRLLYQSRTRPLLSTVLSHSALAPSSSLPLSFGETMIKSLGHKYTKTKWPVCVSPSFYQTRVRRHKEKH